MIKGIIFDLDGTLIDSMGVWNNADRDFLRENGVENPPADISDRMRKMTVDESSEYFISHFGLSCTKEYVIKRIEELVRIQYEKYIPLKPCTEELLDYLDECGIPFGVATATYKNLAQAVLKRCEIYERFCFLLTDSEYPLGKNFPDIFLGGAEILRCAPEEVLVVEDSLHCIRTAKNAGFITVGVYDEVSAQEREKIASESDYYVESLGEIRNILKLINL